MRYLDKTFEFDFRFSKPSKQNAGFSGNTNPQEHNTWELK